MNISERGTNLPTTTLREIKSNILLDRYCISNKSDKKQIGNGFSINKKGNPLFHHFKIKHEY